MKDLDEIDSPQDPLKRVIRNFLYVEWYEVEALKEKIHTNTIGADVELLRSQFADLIAQEPLPIDQLNALTGEEFETSDEARDSLKSVYRQIFPDDERTEIAAIKTV